jgi:predicted nucleotidyltransferase
MKSEINKLKQKARTLAKAEGIRWQGLAKSAKQMVVFGSYACNLQLPDSDFDLLCIGKGKFYKSERIHVIWIGEERLKDPRWLGGELASHISKYGKWIKGRKPWQAELKPDDDAVERKRQRIIARADAIKFEWENLLPVFRKKQLLRLRRDLQRLGHLKNRRPMMPSRCLDVEWKRMRQRQQSWESLLNNERQLKNKVVSIVAKDRWQQI